MSDALSTLQYYVYYKIDPARSAELRATVDALFEEVRAATGIRGRLQRRRDDPATWMELYADVAAGSGFDTALAAALEKSGFARLGVPRVTEIFTCA